MTIETTYLADQPQLVPQIAAWYYNEWGYKELGKSVEKTCERLSTKLNRDRAPIPVIALRDGKLIGAAQLKIREMEIYPEREFWLGGVYVDEAARKQGAAELLVKRIEEISKQLGISELFLQTKMLDGGLYAKLGWTQAEQVRYKGVQVCIMRKEIHL